MNHLYIQERKKPQIPLKIEMNKMYRLHSMDDGKRSEA